MNVGLFIRDFEIGSRVSARLTELGATVEFYDITEVLKPNTTLAIIDLDDKETGNESFIHQLASEQPGLQLLGYMKHIHKESHAKFKIAGCSVILPRSSLVKNLSTFTEK